MMTIQEFQEAVFRTGQEAGFDAMELYVSNSRSFNVKIFQKEVDNYSLSNVLGVGFRGEFAGKMGYAYTEILDNESVSLLVHQAKGNAQLIDSDDEVTIFAGSSEYPEVQAFNDSLAVIPVEEKIAAARRLEETAFAADARVVSVNYALFADGEEEVHMANTKGLQRCFRRNSGACFVMVVVKEGDRVKTGSSYAIGNRWDLFEPEALAEEAVEEAVSMLEAETVTSKSYPIILRNDAAGDMLKTFAGVFSAENVQKGLSRLEGQLGHAVAAPIVTLLDDPLLQDGAASAPFDGEGVAAFTKSVIEEGVLKTFLHNRKTAAKDGIPSTGNAYRSSFKAPIAIAPTNFFVQPGSDSFDALMAQMGEGIIITDLQGLHSGANGVSGDFSLAASGYLVEGGKITGAVDQITVAGNFFDVLRDVQTVGSDLKFGMGGHGGNVGCPSLLIKSLSVAGK